MRSENRIAVAAAVIVLNDRNEILLIRRRLDAQVSKGLWGRPMGKLKFGETGAEAAARETFEETGVQIQITNSIPSGIGEYIDTEKGTHCIILGYLGKHVSGEAQNREPDKHEDVRWFSIAALPQNLAHSTQEAIELMQSS